MDLDLAKGIAPDLADLEAPQVVARLIIRLGQASQKQAVL